MKRFVLNKARQRGVSALELIGYLAVAAIIIATAIGIYNMMTRDSRVNTTMQGMQIIGTKAQEMYNNEADYSGISAEILVKAGNAPPSMINAARDGLQSPWGTMSLDAATEEDADDTFAVTFQRIPDDACQRLANIVKGSSMWRTVSVNGSSYDAIDDVDTSLVDFASGACTGNPNEMIFTARRQ